MNLIKEVEKAFAADRPDFPEFSVGDNINVHLKIKEGAKERIQQYQGTVIAINNKGSNGENYVVRKISHGVGVEKTFPKIATNIEKIEVTRRGSVRRAKIYYLRNKYGKSAVVKKDRKSF